MLLLSNPTSHSTMSEIVLCLTFLTCHTLLVPLLPNPSSHPPMSEIIMIMRLAILTCCALLALLLPHPNLPWAAPLDTIPNSSAHRAVSWLVLRFLLGLCSPPGSYQRRCAQEGPWVSGYVMISLKPMKLWMHSFCLGLWDNMDVPWKHHYRPNSCQSPFLWILFNLLQRASPYHCPSLLRCLMTKSIFFFPFFFSKPSCTQCFLPDGCWKLLTKLSLSQHMQGNKTDVYHHATLTAL